MKLNWQKLYQISSQNLEKLCLQALGHETMLFTGNNIQVASCGVLRFKMNSALLNQL